MRRLLSTLLVVAGISSLTAFAHNHHHSPVKRRKTLGFGPVHPHAVFHSDPYQINTNGFSPLASESDPFDVARRFLEDTLRGQLSDTNNFVIRKDSYTDQNTGVTHVYVRQIVNGLQVADGDINLNIKDGSVISFGNSFFKGSPPQSFPDIARGLAINPHSEYCTQLSDKLQDSRNLEQLILQDGQVVMDSSRRPTTPLELLHEWNCANVPRVQATADTGVVVGPQHALLYFIAVATPNEQLVQDIATNFQEYVHNMSSTMETHFIGSHELNIQLFDNVPDAVSPVKAQLVYTQVPHGDSTTLRLVWKFEVEMQDNWYEATVSVTQPYTIISVVDWASDSLLPIPQEPKEPPQYNVFPWGLNDPSEGVRSIVMENQDTLASPIGWHSLPFANDPASDFNGRTSKQFYRNTTTTWGNNVFAHENWGGRNGWLENYRPNVGQDMVFDFPYNPKETNQSEALDEAKKYINATVTQLFYTVNMIHDLYYRYGFDEVSGNFQQYNFGRGGEENDAVIANAQDGSGYNNANFMTPPDGQNGRCRMYLWSTATPYRDGDLEAGIVIHELSHGLSTRMTGGPANSMCLGWGESGGMGEGWGDFLATVIRSKQNYSDYPMGAWASNKESGIRNYPYSLDEAVNPSTYKTLDKPGYWGVHAVGEVWAEMLWIMNQRLVAKHGYTDNLFPPAPLPDGTIPEGDFYRPAEYTASGKRKPLVPKHGNSLSIQLVLNGMKLQACRPSFFNARDAIIQADQVLTGGENYCELWLAFSRRGLGPKAKVDGRTDWGGGIRKNDFDVPLACQEETVPEEPKPEDPMPEEPFPEEPL